MRGLDRSVGVFLGVQSRPLEMVVGDDRLIKGRQFYWASDVIYDDLCPGSTLLTAAW